MWDLMISVMLCVVLGCLAPEWAGHGSAWTALSVDLDEICKLAHKPFTSRLPLDVDRNFFAMTHFLIVFF